MQNHPIIFVSIDLELWKDNNGKILKIGVSTYVANPIKKKSFNRQLMNIVDLFFQVKESFDLRNGRYSRKGRRSVPDHKENFCFGKSYLFS